MKLLQDVGLSMKATVAPCAGAGIEIPFLEVKMLNFESRPLRGGGD